MYILANINRIDTEEPQDLNMRGSMTAHWRPTWRVRPRYILNSSLGTVQSLTGADHHSNHANRIQLPREKLRRHRKIENRDHHCIIQSSLSLFILLGFLFHFLQLVKKIAVTKWKQVLGNFWSQNTIGNFAGKTLNIERNQSSFFSRKGLGFVLSQRRVRDPYFLRDIT